ncbi:MAG TPA: hypothetical protein VMD97_05695 [Candidatus Aquilonibacter sp.]|nr:hypothetical protein [Candidatus Aquilonibacter sp.]
MTTGTGNWIVSGLSQTTQAISPYSFGGSLINDNGQLSGVLHINQPCFGSGTTDVPYTGTVDAKNNLSIQSAPVAGQILTFHGVLAADGSSITNAGFTVTGGCTGSLTGGTVDEGPGALEVVTAFRIPALAGSWNTTTVVSGPILSEEIMQSSTPDSHGDYALTGAVTVQGSACFTKGTLQPGSFLSGNLGQEVVLMNDGSVLRATFTDSYHGPSSAAVRALDLYTGTITGGACDGPVDEFLQ